MDSANKNVELKIGDTFDNFANADKNNHDKVGANYEKALEIKKLSEDLAYYFDTTLYRFLWHVQTTKVAKVHIPNPDTTKKAIELQIPIRNDDGSPIFDSIAKAIKIGGFSWLEKLDDTHEATKYFLGNEAEGKTAKSGAAVEIKEKVAAYKKRVKELLGDDAEKVDLGMKIEDSETYLDLDGKPRSWEMLNFRDAVAGGALVSMVRIKAEVLNAEYEAVNMLYKQISANDYSFDKIAVITRPSSSYIMQGGTRSLRLPSPLQRDCGRSYPAIERHGSRGLQDGLQRHGTQDGLRNGLCNKRRRYHSLRIQTVLLCGRSHGRVRINRDERCLYWHRQSREDFRTRCSSTRCSGESGRSKQRYHHTQERQCRLFHYPAYSYHG